jgi:putative phosphoribosyl transferase
MFKNRQDAAIQLAHALSAYQNQNPLVLAIPRGAVPMAKVIAQKLNGQMDVVLVHKLRAPFMPEVAIGAIDAQGHCWTTTFAQDMGADAPYLQREKAIQWQTLKHRVQQYNALRKPVSPTDRTVIVVDDGLATGSTMMAALKSLRPQKPAQLVCAVPVASAQALEVVSPLADQVICLMVPKHFEGVGQFYESFEPIDDRDVLQLLKANTELKS